MILHQGRTFDGYEFDFQTWSVTLDLFAKRDEAWRIARRTKAGVVTTLVGQAGNGNFTPGDLPGTVKSPFGVAISDGKLYISSGHAVLKVQAK